MIVNVIGFESKPLATMDYGFCKTRIYNIAELNEEIKHFLLGDTFKGEQKEVAIIYHETGIMEKMNKGGF